MLESLFSTDSTASSAARPGFRPLFCYGSLMHDAVFKRVLNSTSMPVNKPANLEGYKRFKVPGQLYPGITVSSNDSVNGLLVFLESERDYKVLDNYEGDEYQRITVFVYIDELHPSVECDAYLFLGEPSKEEWSFKEFLESYDESA